VGRWPFDVKLFHLLLTAGLIPAHPESVGDHRCQEKLGELGVRPSTAPHAVTETIDAALSNRVSPPVIEAPELCSGAPTPDRLEWILVAWPSLLEAASRRKGAEATCPFCGRQGRIVEVISIDQWRRRPRRGFGEEA
jgi:hypothetical protein